MIHTKVASLGIGTLLAVSILATPSASFAAKKHGNVLTRHPVATGVGAAIVAHKTGKNRMRHGRQRNLAQRHPIATGVVAGMAAHHAGKKHR